MPKRVLTYGVYDLCHRGHIASLRKALMLGDELYVGVFTDEEAEKFKRKPIMTLDERVRAISELGIADVIFSLDSFYPERAIERFNIDIVAKGEGAGWSKDNVPGFKHCKSILLDYTEGISTSELIKRIKEREDL